MDPYFDKPPAPRRPLLSDTSVRTVCGTAIGLGLIGFAHLHPDIAMEILGGAALFAAFIGFLVFFR